MERPCLAILGSVLLKNVWRTPLQIYITSYCIPTSSNLKAMHTFRACSSEYITVCCNSDYYTSPCDALKTPTEGPRSSGLRFHTFGNRRRQHELLPRPLITPLKLCVLHRCNVTPSCSSDLNSTRRDDERAMSDLRGNKSSLIEQVLL